MIDYDVVIIGGGFWRCRLALSLKDHMEKGLILEKEADFLQRATPMPTRREFITVTITQGVF